MKRALYEAWRALPQDNVWSAAAPLEVLWKDDCDGGGGWVEGIARAGGNLLIYLGTFLFGFGFSFGRFKICYGSTWFGGERSRNKRERGNGLCIGNH